MKNYVQEGEVLEMTAPANVSSGDGVLIGDTFGVAMMDALSGARVNLSVEDVFSLPKASGAISEGVKVYWDNSAKNITTTAMGNKLVGACVVAALSGDAKVIVRLNGTTVS